MLYNTLNIFILKTNDIKTGKYKLKKKNIHCIAIKLYLNIKQKRKVKELIIAKIANTISFIF